MASFSVNINRNEGSIKGSSGQLDKQMLSELKKISASLRGKGGAGGIGGRSPGFGAGILGGEAISGMFGGGGLGTLAKGGFWAMLAAGGLIGALNNADQMGGPDKGQVNPYTAKYDQFGNLISGERYGGVHYEQAMVDGEAKVLEIDEKTGDILNIISKREAIEQGILTESGEMKDKYVTTNSLWDQATSYLEKTRDGIVTTTAQLEKIQQATADGQVLEEEINALRRAEIEARQKIVDDLGGTTPYMAGANRGGPTASLREGSESEAAANSIRNEEEMGYNTDVVKYKLSFYNAYSLSNIGQ